VAPLLEAITRPFLRPLRRFVPPIGNIDLTPLVLVIVLQVVLIVIGHLRPVTVAL
jgi:YggT family protein